MSDTKTIGLIGLDTSHVIAFANILNDPSNEHHVPGGKIVAGFPGGSEDMEISISRVEGFTNDLKKDFGVEIMDSPSAVAEAVDMVFITACDGRVHRELFEATAPTGKPHFIDKPFSVTVEDAKAMAELADKQGVALMSCSSLRYADPFAEALKDESLGGIAAIDLAGPMQIQPPMPPLHWYGIHTVEMLVAAMGTGCKAVRDVATDDADLLTAEYADGRVATVRGNRNCHGAFTALLHGKDGPRYVLPFGGPRPGYVPLLEAIFRSLPTGKSDIPIEQTVEVISILEAGNASRADGGKPVAL